MTVHHPVRDADSDDPAFDLTPRTYEIDISFSDMGWQKTFSLARRSKGCHLVTDEVLPNIEEGLKGVQVSPMESESILEASRHSLFLMLYAQVGMLFLFMCVPPVSS